MTDEELDGLLVVLRTLLSAEAPILACQGISRIQTHHKRAVYHNIQVAVSRIEDGTGVPEAATLPIIGRSVKTNLEATETTAALEFGFTCDAHDIIVARCAGAQFVVTQPPVLEREDMEFWLQGLSIDMMRILRTLGLESIDQVQRAHLRALDYDTAAISGLRMVGYERHFHIGSHDEVKKCQPYLLTKICSHPYFPNTDVSTILTTLTIVFPTRHRH